MTDEKVVEKSLPEGRIILTHDLDFSRIVALSQGSLPSVITFRLPDMRPVQVNSYLEEILNQFAGELATGALISVAAIASGCVPCQSLAKEYAFPKLSSSPELVVLLKKTVRCATRLLLLNILSARMSSSIILCLILDGFSGTGNDVKLAIHAFYSFMASGFDHGVYEPVEVC